LTGRETERADSRTASKFTVARETRDPPQASQSRPQTRLFSRRFVQPNVSLHVGPIASAAGPAQSQSHRTPSSAREAPGGRKGGESFLTLAARGSSAQLHVPVGTRRIPLEVAGRDPWANPSTSSFFFANLRNIFPQPWRCCSACLPCKRHFGEHCRPSEEKTARGHAM
jgi:hypothetical protein